jgi:chromate transporter
VGKPSSSAHRPGRAIEVFAAFLKLGLTSFGGPIAHLGYFRHEFVERRRWLDEAHYADLVALCQFLPGPASSQVGMALGLYRAGLAGAVAAWLAFTAPSAIAMVLFAYGVAQVGDLQQVAWLHGLKITAVVIVAQAVWTMGRSLCVGPMRIAIAAGAALLCLVAASAGSQLIAIALGGAAGAVWLSGDDPGGRTAALTAHYPLRWAGAALITFAVLLSGLPLLAAATNSHVVDLIDSFYRTGSLVFGGGHVVLPLLQQEVVPQGWLSDDRFLAGYGAAQAVPGPLFTFAAYLGAAMTPSPNGVAGALICTIAIFLPSLLLVVGALPYWDRLRGQRRVRSVLYGINAAVVGVLLAALYDPVIKSAILGPRDAAIALVGILLLVVLRVPSWIVVLVCTGAAVLARQ